MTSFVTEHGVPTDTVTREQMREIDRVAVEETGPSLLQMMENAGRSLAVLALRHSRVRVEGSRVLVLAGSGGNGGGGICAARHLATRVGHVDLCLTGTGPPTPAAEIQLGIYRKGPGGEVDLDALDPDPPYALIIDAVIGYSLRGAPTGHALRAIELMNASNNPVLSLDLPSGLDADGETTGGISVLADATLTLHLPKPGLAAESAGDLFLADLGIPDAATERVGAEPPRYGRDMLVELDRVAAQPRST